MPIAFLSAFPKQGLTDRHIRCDHADRGGHIRADHPGALGGPGDRDGLAVNLDDSRGLFGRVSVVMMALAKFRPAPGCH